jgi:hypothetical protein
LFFVVVEILSIGCVSVSSLKKSTTRDTLLLTGIGCVSVSRFKQSTTRDTILILI